MEYLRQEIDTGVMLGVQGVQSGPATPGQPVEIGPSGVIDPTLLPLNYDPSIPVLAAENIPAGALCYYTEINGVTHLYLADASASGTLATCFTKAAITAGNTGAAYIYGTVVLPNTGEYTSANIGAPLYLSPSQAGTASLLVPVVVNQWAQTVGSILTVSSTQITMFFTGIFDAGVLVGTNADGTLAPATVANLINHLTNFSNPHLTTAAQVGAVPETALGQPLGVPALDAQALVQDVNLPNTPWNRHAVRCVVKTNTNTTIPGSTLDGLAMEVGDRVLLVGQGAPAQNGVYIWTSPVASLARPADASTGDQLWASMSVVVSGTSAGQLWMNTNATSPVVGSTALTYKVLTGQPLNFVPNLYTHTGDQIVGGLSGAPTVVPAGSNGQVWTIIGGVPTWTTPVLPLPSGGTNGQVLTMQPNGNPLWETPAASGTVLPAWDNSNNGEALTVINGSLAWVTTFINPMNAVGDLVIGSTSGAPQRLAIGQSGMVLTVFAGRPAWGNVASPLPAYGTSNNAQVLTIVAGSPAWAAPVPPLPAYSGANNGQILMVVNGAVTWENAPSDLPATNTSYNGQILTVVNGLAAWATNKALQNPMTAAGQIMVSGSSSSGVASALNPGTNGQVLTMVSGLPAWSASLSLPAYSAANNGQILMVVTGQPLWENLPTPLPAYGVSNNGEVLTIVGGVPAWAPETGSFVSPLTAPGQLMAATTGGAPVAINPGTTGQILTMISNTPTWAGAPLGLPAYGVPNNGEVLTIVGGVPAWSTATIDNGVPNSTTANNGQILTVVAGVAAWTVAPTPIPAFSAGINGEILTVVGGAPAWAAVPKELPVYSGSNNGQFLSITSGAPAWAALPSQLPAYGAPQNNQILTVVSGSLAWTTSTALTNPMTTNGDLLVQAAGAPARLALGTNGQVLTVVSGAPAWANAPVSLPTYSGSNNGQFLGVASGSAAWMALPSQLPAYTGSNNGQVLGVSGGALVWTTPTSVPAYTGSNNGQVLSVVSGSLAWAAQNSLPSSTTSNNGQVLTVVAGVAAWQTLTVTGMVNPMTTSWDLLIGGPGGTPLRLPVGTTKGTVLGVQADGSLGYFSPVNGDPYISDVTALLVGNETGTTTITDATGRSWAMNGTTEVTPTVAHNGFTTVFSFDGVSQSIVGPANDVGYDLTGDFTIEFSMYNPNPAHGGQIMGMNNYGVTSEWTIFGDNGSGGEGCKLTTNQGTVITASFPTAGIWNDVALVRKGSVLYIFVNGSLNNSITWGGVLAFPGGVPISIGSHGNRFGGSGGVWWTGQLGNIRITNGYARYTSAYNVPQTFPTTSGIGMVNPMTTAGDLVTGAASGAPQRLGAGTNGQTLTMVSGVPTWQTPTPGLTNPLTTIGDLLVATTGGAQARMGIGSTGQVLTVVSGLPTWATPTGLTNPMTNLGDLLIGGASGAPTRLAPGTSGYVLTMVSGSPTWSALPSGALPASTTGNNGQVLTVVGGSPAWQTPVTGGGGGGSLPASTINGQVLQVVAGQPTWVSAVAGESFSYWDPTKPFSSPSSMDDEFDGVVLDPKWTWVDPLGATTYDVGTTIPGMLTLQMQNFASDRRVGAMQPLPAGDFTAFIKADGSTFGGGMNPGFFLLLTNSLTPGSGSGGLIGVVKAATTDQRAFIGVRDTAAFWQGSYYYLNNPWPTPHAYIRFRRIGSNSYAAISADGIAWEDLGPFDLGFTPTYIGVGGGDVLSGVPSTVQIDFFRIVLGQGSGVVLGGQRQIASVPVGGNDGQVMTVVNGTPQWTNPFVGDSFNFFDPDAPFATPSVLDDEFSSSTPVLDLSWVTNNWSLLSAYDVNSTVPGRLYMSVPGAAGNTHVVSALRAIPGGSWPAIPTGDFSIWTKVTLNSANMGQYMQAGLILADDYAASGGTSGNQLFSHVFCNEAASTWGTQCSLMSNFLTYVSSPVTNMLFPGPTAYIRIRRQSGVYYHAFSSDGLVWTEQTLSVPFTPYFFGLAAASANTNPMTVTFDFFRYKADATARLGATRQIGNSAIVGDVYNFFDPDMPPVHPTAYNDEFKASSWGNALDPMWTVVNGSVLSVFDVNGSIPDSLHMGLPGGTGSTLVAALQTIPIGDFTAWAKVSASSASTNPNNGLGLLLTDGVTAGAGHQYMVASYCFQTQAEYCQFYHWTGFNATSGGYAVPNARGINYIRIRRLSGMLYGGSSEDGKTWTEQQIGPGFTPAYIGLFVTSPVDATDFSFDFFRIALDGNAQLGGIRQIGNANVYAGDSFSFFDPDKPPSPPSPLDDEFDATSTNSWSNVINWPGIATDVNSTVPGCLWAEASDMGRLLAVKLKQIPVGNFTIWTKIASSSSWSGTTDNGLGLVLTDGTNSGQGTQLMLSASQWSTGEDCVSLPTFTGFNAISGATPLYYSRGTRYLRLRRNGSELSAGWSADGKTWTQVILSPSFTPAYFGLAIQCYQQGVTDNSFEFFRYSAAPLAVLGGYRQVSAPAAVSVPIRSQHQRETLGNDTLYAVPGPISFTNIMMIRMYASSAGATWHFEAKIRVFGATGTVTLQVTDYEGNPLDGGSTSTTASDGLLLVSFDHVLSSADVENLGGACLTLRSTGTIGTVAADSYLSLDEYVPNFIVPAISGDIPLPSYADNGKVLTVVNSVPTWGAGGFVNPMTANYDLILGGYGGEPIRLPMGTWGQVLTTVNLGSGNLAVQWAHANVAPDFNTSYVNSLLAVVNNGSGPVMQWIGGYAPANGDVMTIVSGVPTWAAPVGGGGSGGSGAVIASGQQPGDSYAIPDATQYSNGNGSVLTYEYNQNYGEWGLFWDTYYAMPDYSWIPIDQNGNSNGGYALVIPDGQNTPQWVQGAALPPIWNGGYSGAVLGVATDSSGYSHPAWQSLNIPEVTMAPWMQAINGYTNPWEGGNGTVIDIYAWNLSYNTFSGPNGGATRIDNRQAPSVAGLFTACQVSAVNANAYYQTVWSDVDQQWESQWVSGWYDSCVAVFSPIIQAPGMTSSMFINDENGVFMEYGVTTIDGVTNLVVNLWTPDVPGVFNNDPAAGGPGNPDIWVPTYTAGPTQLCAFPLGSWFSPNLFLQIFRANWGQLYFIFSTDNQYWDIVYECGLTQYLADFTQDTTGFAGFGLGQSASVNGGYSAFNLLGFDPESLYDNGRPLPVPTPS